jgi:tetratricopeptide (TPR) repeat protein
MRGHFLPSSSEANSRRHLICVVLAVLVQACSGPKVTLPDTYEALMERVRVDSADAEAHYNAALAHWSKERWDGVERELLHALEIDPLYADAYMALGFLPFARRDELLEEERRTGDPTVLQKAMLESDRRIRRALLIDPFTEQTIVKAAGLEPLMPTRLVVIGGDIAFVAVGGYYDAVRDFYDGQYDKAFERLTKIYEEAEDPRSVSDGVLTYRARSAVQLSRYDTAIHDMEVLFARALYREQQGQDEGSFLAANDIRYILGCLEFRSGRLTSAMEHLSAAAELDPSLYMAHVRMGDIYEHRRHWSEAISQRQAALSLAPENTALRRDLALTLYRAGEAEEAAGELRAVVEQNPLHSLAWYDLGVVLQDLGQTSEARRALEHFVQIVPTRYGEHRADAEARLGELAPRET